MLSGARCTWHVRARTRRPHRLLRWNNTHWRCYASPVSYWEEAAAASDEGDGQISQSAPSDDAPSDGDLDPRNGTFMGIVTARRPRETSLDTLLEQITSRPATTRTKPISFPSLLITLLTSTYAQHAESEELPLRILERLAENPTISKPLDAVTAVVDRLPVPNGAKNGNEGLAYAFFANCTPLDTASQTSLQPDAQKPGSLTFKFLTRASLPGKISFQMPLASTVFSTGKPSTLIHTRFQYDPVSGHLKKSATAQLETQTVPLPTAAGGRPRYLDFQAPLAPLTPMREISNCYGNIVQKLRPFDEAIQGTGESNTNVLESHESNRMPASQELERAVSEYFQLVGLDPQPVEVWALITPPLADLPPHPHREKMEELGALQSDSVKQFWLDSTTPNPDLIRDSIAAYLRYGARLAKVLSGGGGWGKKAGLLSLDPDTTYSTRHLRSEQGWNINLDDENAINSIEGRDKGSFSEVVSSGEGIMFFIALKDRHIKPASQAQSQQTATKVTTFGSIPSTIDDIFENPKVEVDEIADSGNGCEYFPDTFGMLSEGGMAIQQMQRNTDAIYSKTKADVPFATMTIGQSRNNEDQNYGWSYPRNNNGTPGAKVDPQHRTKVPRGVLQKLDEIEAFGDDRQPKDFDAKFLRQRIHQFLDAVQFINAMYMVDIKAMKSHRKSASDNAAQISTSRYSQPEDETSPLVLILEAYDDLESLRIALAGIVGTLKADPAQAQGSRQAVSKKKATGLKRKVGEKRVAGWKRPAEQDQLADDPEYAVRKVQTGPTEQDQLAEDSEYGVRRELTMTPTRKPRRTPNKAKKIEPSPDDAMPTGDGCAAQGNHIIRKVPIDKEFLKWFT